MGLLSGSSQNVTIRCPWDHLRSSANLMIILPLTKYPKTHSPNTTIVYLSYLSLAHLWGWLTFSWFRVSYRLGPALFYTSLTLLEPVNYHLEYVFLMTVSASNELVSPTVHASAHIMSANIQLARSKSHNPTPNQGVGNTLYLTRGHKGCRFIILSQKIGEVEPVV